MSTARYHPDQTNIQQFANLYVKSSKNNSDVMKYFIISGTRH